MNVNLVSPVDNGNNFVIRFKEDIVVPQNSKVYLNFASLSRENDVELYEDQTLKLVFENADIRPNLLPYGTFEKNGLMANNIFTIPKGTYNYQKLYTNITTGINTLLQDALNPADLSMYRAVALSDIDNTDVQIVQGQVSFSLGLMKEKISVVPHRDFDIDLANNRNCDDNATSGYQKTSDTALGNAGLKKVNTAGGGAFNPDATSGYVEGNTSMTGATPASPRSVVGQLLQNDGAGGGIGTLGSVNFDIVDGGKLKMTNQNATGIGNAFHTIGASDKANGLHNEVLTGGTGANATIQFNVQGGAIQFNTITFSPDVGGDAGTGYSVGDILTISAFQTGGTADFQLEVKTLSISIDYASIRVNAIGKDYQIGDVLKISNLSPNDLGTGSAHNTIAVQTLQNSAYVPFFDNYSMSNRHYWHVGYDDDTPFDNTNLIKFTTKHSANDMIAGNMCSSIGFASSEVALGINGSNGAYPLNSGKRTSGTDTTTSDGTSANPQNVPLATSSSQAKHLAGFVMVEIDGRGANCFLKVRIAQTGTGNFVTSGLHTWDSCNKPIGAMSQVAGDSINLASTKIAGYEMSNQFKGGIQTYYDKNNLDDLKLYFRVLNLNNVPDGAKPINAQTMVIYDSRTATPPCFFPDAFFRCPDATIIDYGNTSEFPSISDDNTTFASGTNTKNHGAHGNILLTSLTGTGSGARISFSVSDGTDAFTAGQIIPSTLLTSVFDGDGYRVGDELLIPNNQGVGGTADSAITIKKLGTRQGANRINSQLPLNVIVSALTKDDGFTSITAPFFTKKVDNTKPLSIINKYEIEATEELSRYLNIFTAQDRVEGHSAPLHPNTGDAMNPNLVHIEGMNLDWRNESYSISLKELPIKNFKNTEAKSQGGFGKTILANCPVPFSDAQSYMTKSKAMITATYKPNYQIISNLYNQALTTNHFSVEIRKLATDKPANEILKSIINFTIMPPDDYTGNINSVDLLKS